MKRRIYQRLAAMGLSTNILIMGIASFLTDFSSEMIFPILPLFLVGTIGVSKLVLGLIEGVAESGSSFLKVFSGWMSDRYKKRKVLTIFGYFLSAISKPAFAFIGSAPMALFLRTVERAGKGIRTAPRDALIAASVPEDNRGKAFGFHRTMDNAGELLGPTLATVLLVLGLTYRQIFLVSAIPALLAVFILLWLKESKEETDGGAPAEEEDHNDKNWWRERRVKILFLGVGVGALGAFNKALLFPLAQEKGIATQILPLLYLAAPITATLVSYPAGVISDQIGRKVIILIGYLSFAVMALLWIGVDNVGRAITAFIFLGLYVGLVEGQQRALVSDLVSARKRGTALGAFHALVGLAVLPSNLIAGAFYSFAGPDAMLAYGGIMTVIGAIILSRV